MSACVVVAPWSMEAPQVRVLMATDLQLTWRPPTVYTGPLTHYVMTAYLLDHVTSSQPMRAYLLDHVTFSQPINATVGPLANTGKAVVPPGEYDGNYENTSLILPVGSGDGDYDLYKKRNPAKDVLDGPRIFNRSLQCFDAVGWAAGRASGL